MLAQAFVTPNRTGAYLVEMSCQDSGVLDLLGWFRVYRSSVKSEGMAVLGEIIMHCAKGDEQTCRNKRYASRITQHERACGSEDTLGIRVRT